MSCTICKDETFAVGWIFGDIRLCTPCMNKLMKWAVKKYEKETSQSRASKKEVKDDNLCEACGMKNKLHERDLCEDCV